MATLAVRSILCPVDFSEPSRQALLWAAAIAWRRSAALIVMSVVDPLLAQAAGIRLHVDLAEADVEPALREFVDATLPASVRQASQVRMVVRVGDTADAILQTARRLDTGLVVMGTHGRGGFRKLILGSTTEQVLRRTEWPVLAVPPGAVSAPEVEHPGVQLNKILVATDFREGALAAMRWAGDLASDISVPLVLAHVVEPVVVSELWQPLVADLDNDHVAAAQRTLARLAAGFRDEPNDYVVSVGPPAETIASLAKEHDAGLVIMGLANAEDWGLRAPGSTAYHVLRIGHVAVVVVPRCATRAAGDRAAQASLAQPSAVQTPTL